MMVKTEVANGIGSLVLCDPARLNAMSEEMAECFAEAVGKLKEQRIRVLILSGAGSSFSAGGDLEMLQLKHTRDLTTNTRDMLSFYQAFLSLLDLQVPLIAAVHGWAVGAGCCLMAACDLRLAEQGARFRAPFLSMGLFPGMGATYWFSQRMAPWAAEFLLTGSTWDLETAYQRGLVTQCCEAGQLLSQAQARAEQILKNGPEATLDLLRTLRGDLQPLRAALKSEAELQARSYNRLEFAQRIEQLRKLRST